MRHTKRMVAVLAAATLALTACGDGGDEGDTPEETETTEDEGGEATEGEETEGEEGDGEAAADLSGAEVSIFGAPTSIEAESINGVIEEYFNGPTGANAFYEGSDQFESQIQIRAEGGNPPDVALFPQPGALVDQADQGNLISLEDLGFDMAQLESQFGEYLLSLGEHDGQHYGLPTNVNFKSLVWYNIPVFEAEGYEVPETWDELIELSDQMVADGYTPWAIGTGSDDATGWPATDWMEDIVLRQAGPDVYDQWVNHEIPFDDPAIVEAAETFDTILSGENYIVGERSQIPDIDFREIPAAIIGDEPDALLHRQASFITSFFPEGSEFGTDYGVFPFPSIDGNDGALIAGELAGVYSDDEAVVEFLRTFTGAEAQCAQGSYGDVGRISPNTETDASCYDNEAVATSAQSTLDAISAGTARFDASDLMPPQVGSGSFWTAMNEWMRGGDVESLFADVESSWPAE